jgi:hypothetical protein
VVILFIPSVGKGSDIIFVMRIIPIIPGVLYGFEPLYVAYLSKAELILDVLNLLN